jgi:hypothetical protein
VLTTCTPCSTRPSCRTSSSRPHQPGEGRVYGNRLWGMTNERLHEKGKRRADHKAIVSKANAVKNAEMRRLGLNRKPSPVRRIDPKTGEVIEVIPVMANVKAPTWSPRLTRWKKKRRHKRERTFGDFCRKWKEKEEVATTPAPYRDIALKFWTR